MINGRHIEYREDFAVVFQAAQEDQLQSTAAQLQMLLTNLKVGTLQAVSVNDFFREVFAFGKLTAQVLWAQIFASQAASTEHGEAAAG